MHAHQNIGETYEQAQLITANRLYSTSRTEEQLVVYPVAATEHPEVHTYIWCTYTKTDNMKSTRLYA